MEWPIRLDEKLISGFQAAFFHATDWDGNTGLNNNQNFDLELAFHKFSFWENFKFWEKI